MIETTVASRAVVLQVAFAFDGLDSKCFYALKLKLSGRASNGNARIAITCVKRLIAGQNADVVSGGLSASVHSVSTTQNQPSVFCAQTRVPLDAVSSVHSVCEQLSS